MMMRRMGLPVLVSLGLSTLGMLHAYHSRSQFYPATIYIVKSNLLMAIAYFQALISVILVGNLMKKIFLGSLRASEFESLIDRSWYAVLETFLTFAIFKDNFSDKFVGFFSMLLFLKVFHWLGEVRVNFMEQSPANSALFHIRVLSLAMILAFLDMKLILHSYSSTQQDGDSVQLVFGFEYAVLLTVVMNFFIKYLLHCVDLRSESPWHNKPIYMLYAELVIGFIKVVLYTLFILITLRIYTIPLFAIRPMYLNLRALKKTFVGIVSSYQAIYIMDAHYSQATPEQLASADNICTICRDEMVAQATKILPCNHIFHKSCLRSWFQRQQTCPTCRHDVIQSFRRQRHTQPTPTNNNNVHANNNNIPAQQPTPPGQAAQQPLHQQIQIPQFPGFNPNIFAQMAAAANIPQQFPFPPPVPQPTTATGQQNNASASSTTPTSGNNNTATSSTDSSLPPTPSQFNLPFPFPPLPPFPSMFSSFRPPPMPPADFRGLSDEELRAMEGNERKNVEARIECLKNIQVLLDAAMLEMQQYSSILSKVDDVSNNFPLPTAETGARPKESTHNKTPAETGDEKEIIDKMDSNSSPSPSSTESSDKEEVRRRRLEKFTNIPSDSSS
uniref:RING-type E3 ubiquitin transferase n=1 Tax=Lepeophtheirus salmonis TaxID=72036 RepID=A0A0K2U5W1_LEPSM